MVNLVIMGAGLIGYRHVKLVADDPHLQLVGVVDPDISRHLDDGNRYFASLDDIDSPVDGVIIATPTGLHFEHATEALARGWHLLIEKPVTATPEEADALIPLVQQAKRHCLVGHHRRYHPAVQTLRERVAADEFGTITTSTMMWAMKKPDGYFANNWRTTDGSPVMINTIHDIDLMRFVLGEIVSITGLATNHIRQEARVESAALSIAFASGAIGVISISDTALSPWGFEAGIGENPNIGTTGQDMWWITGTKGAISFPSLTSWAGAEDWGRAVKPQSHDSHKVTPLQAQLEHFRAVIQGSEAPLITVEDAAASLKATWMIEQQLAAQI